MQGSIKQRNPYFQNSKNENLIRKAKINNLLGNIDNAICIYTYIHIHTHRHKAFYWLYLLHVHSLYKYLLDSMYMNVCLRIRDYINLYDQFKPESLWL